MSLVTKGFGGDQLVTLGYGVRNSSGNGITFTRTVRLFSRLDVSGLDFTVQKWNDNIDKLEAWSVLLFGMGVVTGLDLSAGIGLSLLVSDGTINARSVVSFTGVVGKTAPTNTTSYVWIDEFGTIEYTTIPSFPGNVVCLGSVTTNGTTILSVSETNRMQILNPLQSVGQTEGYSQISVDAISLILTKSQYKNKFIEFTGILTANISVSIPPVPGYEWTIVDSTTGAFSILFKTISGTGVSLVHTQSRKFWTDGVSVRPSIV